MRDASPVDLNVLHRWSALHRGMEYHYAKKRGPEAMEYYKEALKAFLEWNDKAMAPGEPDRKTKGLVAVECAYVTRCPYCIEGHAEAAVEAGATKEMLAEVIQIAMALAAGARIAHRNLALDV